MREVRETKTENKVWKIINRERRKRKRVDQGIQMRSKRNIA